MALACATAPSRSSGSHGLCMCRKTRARLIASTSRGVSVNAVSRMPAMSGARSCTVASRSMPLMPGIRWSATITSKRTDAINASASAPFCASCTV